jgi:hypothetical protein
VKAGAGRTLGRGLRIGQIIIERGLPTRPPSPTLPPSPRRCCDDLPLLLHRIADRALMKENGENVADVDKQWMIATSSATVAAR